MNWRRNNCRCQKCVFFLCWSAQIVFIISIGIIRCVLDFCFFIRFGLCFWLCRFFCFAENHHAHLTQRSSVSASNMPFFGVFLLFSCMKFNSETCICFSLPLHCEDRFLQLKLSFVTIAKTGFPRCVFFHFQLITQWLNPNTYTYTSRLYSL